MVIRTFSSIAVMSALGVLLPIQAHAFGLGKIELSSALNEPFKAEIAVTSLRDNEIDDFQVQLASNKEFERAGLVRSSLLTQFQFEVVEKAGKTSIMISTKQAVKEPFVDFLLTATTGNGRLIREYTVLLDPPKNIFSKPKLTVPVASVKPSTTTSSYQYTAPTLSSATTYGPTGRTDTLWDIALKTRPEKSISVHQMMMGILNENPRAFLQNNINGLKAGYTLSIPSIEKLEQLSKAQAISAVTEQNTLWKNRNKQTVKTEVVVASEMAETVTNTEQPPAEPEQDLAVSESTLEDDTARLKLVAPSDEMAMENSELSPLGSDEITKLSEQLTLAQETIEGQAQENIDIKSRMDVMEEQIQTLRRLISLKDADLARLQSSLEQEGVTDIELSSPALEDEIPMPDIEQLQAETSDIDQDLVADDVEQMVESSETLLEAESTQTEVEESREADSMIGDVLNNVDLSFMPTVDEVISYTSDLSGVDENEVKSLLEKLKMFVAEHKQETTFGTLLLLLVLWLIIRRRNRPEMTWDEAIGKKADKKTSNIEVAVPVVEETVEPDYTEVEEEEPTVDDLMADANVYISYGDFDKAQETLDQARDIEPSNEEIMHKQLFVLFKKEQAEEFIDLAKLYQNETSASDWEEVAIWGRNLAPEHQLFKIVAEEVIAEDAIIDESTTNIDSTENEEPEENLSIDKPSPSPLELNNTSEVEFKTEDSDTELSLEIDNELSLENIDESTLDEDTLTLDISNKSQQEDIIDNASLELDINNSDDESFELNGLDEISEDELTVATEALSEKNDLEFDLGDFDQVDEAETKLDLAAAYIDMGDPDGAKSILEEVINEGNDEQKTRAQAMLNDLS